MWRGPWLGNPVAPYEEGVPLQSGVGARFWGRSGATLLTPPLGPQEGLGPWTSCPTLQSTLFGSGQDTPAFDDTMLSHAS